MKNPIAKTLLVGLVGGLTLNFVMVLTFRLIGFGWHGGGILLNPSIQSRKLIAVWTQMEPLPLVVSHPVQIFVGLILFGIGHAFIYRWLAPAWPHGIKSRRGGWLVSYFFSHFSFGSFLRLLTSSANLF